MIVTLIVMVVAGFLVLGDAASFGRMVGFVLVGGVLNLILWYVMAKGLEATLRARFGEDVVDAHNRGVQLGFGSDPALQAATARDPVFNVAKLSLWALRWGGSIGAAALLLG